MKQVNIITKIIPDCPNTYNDCEILDDTDETFIIVRWHWFKQLMIFRKSDVKIERNLHFKVGDYVHLRCKEADNSYNNDLVIVEGFEGDEVLFRLCKEPTGYVFKRSVDYFDIKVVPQRLVQYFLNEGKV